MQTHNFEQHLYEMSGGMTRHGVAQALKMTYSTLARQLDGTLKVETVVAACRHFGAPLIPAFVAAGFITQEEADAAQLSLTQVADRDLVAEMTKRLAQPHPDPIYTQSENVVHLNARQHEEDDTPNEG